MKLKGSHGNKKWWLFLMAPLVCIALAVGAVAVTVTREPALERFQIPNSVEAWEANRKLQILSASLTNGRKGYVRLGELEINSLIETASKRNATNGSSMAVPSPVRGTVLLTRTNCTLITWHQQSKFFFSPTFPLQRTLTLAAATNRPSFELTGLRVGKLALPRPLWSWAEKNLDPERAQIREKMPWLAKAVAAEFSTNDLSRMPEIRLYSYMPAHLKP